MTIAAMDVDLEQRLLNVEQMARFVIDGFIEFDDLVPDDLNEAVNADLIRTVGPDGLAPDYR